MKIGDTVKILTSFGGPGGTFTGSTPWKDELVTVTEANIDFLTEALSGKMVEVLKTEKAKKNATPDILPDIPAIGGGDSTGDIQPKRGRKV